jgi:mannose-6-phosphate isomerase-like protein (cupin superfamily)
MKHYIAGDTILTIPNGKKILKTQEKLTFISEKVWGSEELIFNSNHCVKIMRLKPGYQVSLHWHEQKEETFILYSGHLVIESVNKLGEHSITTLTKPLESFTLLRNTPHTFYCPVGQEEETVFIEASTKDHADDSYRIFPSSKR